MKTDKEKNFISAVVYVHNDEKKIVLFLRQLIEVLEENFDNSEIICVNDCSNDDSVKRIKEISMSASNLSISVLNMSYYHGMELAMNAGVELSIGDFVFEFDSIFVDYEKMEMVRVYKKALEGYDMVSASSDGKQRISSKVFYQLFCRFGQFGYQMNTERFRILSRRLIHRVGSVHRVISYRKAVYAGSGLKTEQLIYPALNQTDTSENKEEKKYRWRLAVNTLIMYTDLGYCFSVFITFLMMFLAIFMAGYSFTFYLTGSPVAGWTTTILFLSAAFFGLFGILTVIIKYLQLLLDMTLKRKQYNFESIEKIV